MENEVLDEDGALRVPNYPTVKKKDGPNDPAPFNASALGSPGETDKGPPPGASSEELPPPEAGEDPGKVDPGAVQNAGDVAPGAVDDTDAGLWRKAIEEGDCETLRGLLAKDALYFWKYEKKNGGTLLHVAATKGGLALAEHVLDMLSWAQETDDPDMHFCDSELDADNYIESETFSGKTAFVLAQENNHAGIGSKICDFIANNRQRSAYEKMCEATFGSSIDRVRPEILSWNDAIKKKDCQALLKLLRLERDAASFKLWADLINVDLENGKEGRQTALQTGAMQGCFPVVKLVLEKFDNACGRCTMLNYIEAVDDQTGLTAFEMANDIIGNRSIGEYMKEFYKEASYSNETIKRRLHVKVENDDHRIQVFQSLISFEAYPDTRWYTALERGHTTELKKLLELNSRLLLETWHGLTVLHVAILRDDLELVKAVVKVFGDGGVIKWGDSYYPSTLHLQEMIEVGRKIDHRYLNECWNALTGSWKLIPNSTLKQLKRGENSILLLAEKLERTLIFHELTQRNPATTMPSTPNDETVENATMPSSPNDDTVENSTILPSTPNDDTVENSTILPSTPNDDTVENSTILPSTPNDDTVENSTILPSTPNDDTVENSTILPSTPNDDTVENSTILPSTPNDDTVENSTILPSTPNDNSVEYWNMPSTTNDEIEENSTMPSTPNDNREEYSTRPSTPNDNSEEYSTMPSTPNDNSEEYSTMPSRLRDFFKEKWMPSLDVKFREDVDFNFEDVKRQGWLKFHYACKDPLRFQDFLSEMEIYINQHPYDGAKLFQTCDGKGRTPFHILLNHCTPDKEPGWPFDEIFNGKQYKEWIQIAENSRGKRIIDMVFIQNYILQNINLQPWKYFNLDIHHKKFERSEISTFLYYQVAHLLKQRNMAEEIWSKFLEKKDMKNVMEKHPDEFNSMLFIAASTGNQTCLQLLLDTQHDPMITDTKGRSLLHHAADPTLLLSQLVGNCSLTVEDVCSVKKKWIGGNTIYSSESSSASLNDFNTANFNGSNTTTNYNASNSSSSINLNSNTSDLTTGERSNVGRKACILMLLQAGVDLGQADKDKKVPNIGPTIDATYQSWWYDTVVKDSTDKRNSYSQAGNALSVVGTLVAATSYIGPLQPPLSYDTSIGTGFVKTIEPLIKVFMVTNSLAFYLAMASVMFAVVSSLPMPQEGVMSELKRAKHAVSFSLCLLLIAIGLMIISFATASIVAIQNEHSFEGSNLLFSPSIIGWFFCFLGISGFLIRLARLMYYKNTIVRKIYQFSFSKIIGKCLLVVILCLYLLVSLPIYVIVKVLYHVIDAMSFLPIEVWLWVWNTKWKIQNSISDTRDMLRLELSHMRN